MTNNGSSRKLSSGSLSKSSRSIPIRHPITRTESEIQLCEDEQMADMRDYHMYVRIVSGMQQQYSVSNGVSPTLHNIIRTRNSPVDNDNDETEKTKHYLPGFERSSNRLQDLDTLADDMFLIEDTSCNFDSSMSSIDTCYGEDDCGIFDMDDL